MAEPERVIQPERIINPGNLDRLLGGQVPEKMGQSDADAFIAEMTEPETPPRDETGKFTARAPEKVEPAEPVSEPEGTEAVETAPQEAETEPADNSTAIDPPASWTAEAKEHFAQLTPELQRYVAQRESEREKGISQKLNESTAAQKAAQAAIEAAQAERNQSQALLQAASQYISELDPVLAEGMKTDWAAESIKDPAGTQTKFFEFQKRAQVAQQMQAKVAQMAQQANQERLVAYVKNLSQTMPDFVDPVKGPQIRESYAPVLKAVGYSDGEIQQGWGIPRDVREMKILDMAAKGFALENARAKLADKKVAQPAPKVGKPAATQTPQGRQAAIEKRLADQLKHAPGTVKGLSNDKYIDRLTELLTLPRGKQ